MCQQIIQLCSSSTKPLLVAGSFLTLLSAVAIGYTGCDAHALYLNLDQTVANNTALAYHLQLAAALYLMLVTILVSFAAYHDQKHSIRALAIVTALNFVLAAAAIFMVPTGLEVGNMFDKRLEKARGIYNFTDSPIVNNIADTTTSLYPPSPSEQTRKARMAGNTTTEQPNVTQSDSELTPQEATRIWDGLQAKGCCGFRNATTEWKDTIPKSCCSAPTKLGDKFVCEKIDDGHSRACIEVIGSTSLNLLIVLALIAMVNLYLATVTGVNAYRTFHYNEASQNNYS